MGYVQYDSTQLLIKTKKTFQPEWYYMIWLRPQCTVSNELLRTSITLIGIISIYHDTQKVVLIVPKINCLGVRVSRSPRSKTKSRKFKCRLAFRPTLSDLVQMAVGDDWKAGSSTRVSRRIAFQELGFHDDFVQPGGTPDLKPE